MAAQERAEGDEDEQSAKDRVDEAIGEDAHIAEEQAQAASNVYDARPDIAALREEIKNLKELVVKAQQKPEPVENSPTKERLTELAAMYLN